VEVAVSSQPTSHYADNPSDYWEVPTHGYAGSHYAVWPPALLERPIKSMVPSKVCTVCGEPSRRITQTNNAVAATAERHDEGQRRANASDANVWKQVTGDTCAAVETLGWTDCGHGDNYRPGIVLDPFGGSGTTLAVATGHGHHAIGIDLDARNVHLARERVGPMFLDEFTLDEWKNR